jgi:hypothetical protein
VENRTLCSHDGRDIHEVLTSLHTHLRPVRYLEIGTWTGGSLALASCASLAIDPHFSLATDVVTQKPICALCQMTSDDFFRNHDPTQILGGPIDFAFLDGLHLFEALLRDFINTEKFCRRNSVVALHDCIPPLLAWAPRTPPPNDAWTGDVWKVPLILRKYRPELKIYPLNSPPSGLILITNLDPASSVLSSGNYDMVEEFRDLDLAALDPAALAEMFQTMSTDLFETAEQLSQYFWL